MTSIGELLQYGKDVLEQSGNEYAKYERKVLLEEVLGMKYLQMLACADDLVPDEKVRQYRDMLKKRCNHYPLQYILGYAHFMDYTFHVNENVLIPRNDTEILVELVLDILSKEKSLPDYSVLDMCCGSGCIGISLKLYHPEIDLSLCDISKEALKVSEMNLKKYNVKAQLFESDLFEHIEGHYSMIVSNPPYIEHDVIDTLMPEVKDYEPRMALDGGQDGLDFYKKIILDAVKHLRDNGYLIFEIGYNQGNAVCELMKKAGFNDVNIKKDYAGLDRVVCGHL